MYRREIISGRTEMVILAACSTVACLLGLIITKVFVIPIGWALPILIVGIGIVSIGLVGLSKSFAS